MGLETIALVAAGAASLAGAGASAYSSHKQAEATKDAAKDQKAELRRQRAELEEKEKRSAAARAGDVARRRQLALAGGAQGLSSTQKTGPLGLSQVGGYPRRTLLGG